MRPSRLAAPALVLGFLLFAACGGEDFTSAGGEGGSGAGQSGPGPGPGPSGPGSGAGPSGCAASEVCVSTPPGGGWKGPVALWGQGEPAECAGDWPNEELSAFVGMVSGAHSCDPCVCEAPANGACGAPTVTLFASNLCVNMSGSAVPDADGACTGMGSTLHVKVGEVPVIPGGCAPHGGGAQLATPGWEGRSLLCGGNAGGDKCGDDGTCHAKPGAPFEARVCIYSQEEGATCPPSWPVEQVLHQDYDDTRGCKSCACGEEEGASCTGTVYAYGTTPCSGGTGGVALPKDGACKDFAAAPVDELQWSLEGRTDGECPSSGGEPKGGLVPTKPVVVCCSDPL